MSERDLQRMQHRQPQHRPPQQNRPAPKAKPTLPPGSSANVARANGVGLEQAPMHDESQALFSLLDWQKECRARGVDCADILKVQPRSMFDKVSLSACGAGYIFISPVPHPAISRASCVFCFPPRRDQFFFFGESSRVDTQDQHAKKKHVECADDRVNEC